MATDGPAPRRRALYVLVAGITGDECTSWGFHGGQALRAIGRGGDVAWLDPRCTANHAEWPLVVVAGYLLHYSASAADPARCHLREHLAEWVAGDQCRVWVHAGGGLLSSRRDFQQRIEGFVRELQNASQGDGVRALRALLQAKCLPYNRGLGSGDTAANEIQQAVEEVSRLMTGAARVDKRDLDSALGRLDLRWERLEAEWQLKALRPLFALSVDLQGLLAAQRLRKDLAAYLEEVRRAWGASRPAWMREAKGELGPERWEKLGVDGVLQHLAGCTSLDTCTAQHFVDRYQSMANALHTETRKRED